MTITAIDHLSYSSLSSLACPYAFFLRLESGIRGPQTSWMALGNAVHLGLELGHQNDDFDVALAVKAFEKEFNRIIFDEDVVIGYPQLRKAISEGTDMVVLYNEQVQSGLIPKAPLALEKEFKITIAGVSFEGRIDKIDTEENPETGEIEYIITDFKSGKEKPDPWFLNKDNQFTIYWIATKELYGKYPKKAVYHHLRSGDRLETVRTEEDINRLIVTVQNAVKMRELGIRHRIYTPKVCGWCDYRGPVCDDQTLEQELVARLEGEAIGEPPEVLGAS